MLALLNRYDDASRELLRSLEVAGIDLTPLVILYDGELPEGALCPFVAYTGLETKGEPLFFNQVPVPQWCEIRQGGEVFGEVLRDGVRIARINYEPSSFRDVESVDWLLPDGSMSHTDRYDRYGKRYATTHYAGGVDHQTVYAGPGEWTLEVDHVLGAVTMRSATTLLTFGSLAELVSHFIDDLGLDDERVLINSLSHPLFVMRQRAAAPNTTLFWQEPLERPEAIPGNMAAELAEPRALERIVFFDEQQQQTVSRSVSERHAGSSVDLAYLSHLGQFSEHSGYDPQRVFVLTNSDEIPGLAELLEALPDVTFSVAALTLMSERLHALARRFPNLVLTPSASHGQIGRELGRASVYLDINAGGQVLDVVKAAYHLDLVVLALAPVAKAPGHALVLDTLEELTDELTAVTRDPAARQRALERLHTLRGPQSAQGDYQRLLG